MSSLSPTSPRDSAQIDAIGLSDAVRARLVDFHQDRHWLRDPHLGAALRELWSQSPEAGGLLSHLWVEAAPPPQSSGTGLGELVREGVFNAALADHLDGRGVLPRSRPLYSHQREAVLKGVEEREDGARPALVVTAPAGAGKTEAFLLPLLNDLWTPSLKRTPAAQNGGVKAILLYPMNALVNDQVERLEGWLSGQSTWSFFHFTSETPESEHAANKAGTPKAAPWRRRTRQEARLRVPDILITNYSMLEYMLCRPQDAPFFGPDLRALVLDEAHLYAGTLAAEITLLLRRLLLRCERAPREVLHLATLGGTRDDLRDFAAALFDKERDLVEVIEGRHAPESYPALTPPATPPTAQGIADAPWPRAATICLDPHSGEAALAPDAEAAQGWRDLLPMLVAKTALDEDETYPARALCGLEGAPLMQQLSAHLRANKRVSLPALARELWREDGVTARRATAILLQMGAAKRGRLSPRSAPRPSFGARGIGRSGVSQRRLLRPANTGMGSSERRRWAKVPALHSCATLARALFQLWRGASGRPPYGSRPVGSPTRFRAN